MSNTSNAVSDVIVQASANIYQKKLISKNRIGAIILNFIVLMIGLICLIPLLLVISASLTEEKSLALHGYRLFPTEFSTYAYSFLFKDAHQLYVSYGLTISITLIGTLLSLFVTSLLAYPLSRKDFRFANAFSFYVFFTMLFSGGLVPAYILVTQYLHLKNTLWALILPLLIQPFYVLLMRTFFATVPDSLIESAKIEGAGEIRIFFQIIVPLSTPVIATIGLFMSLIYWNDWFNALLYIDNRNFLPLQYLLIVMMSNIQVALTDSHIKVSILDIPSESARMAMAVLAIGPIALCIYTSRNFLSEVCWLGLLRVKVKR